MPASENLSRYNQSMATKNFTSINDLIKKYKALRGPSGHSGSSKESEPFVLKQEVSSEIQEVVEHRPEEEVSTYVAPRAETIDIPPDLKQFGLQPAATTQFPSYQNIKLPLSDEKIVVGLHAPITSSLRWLATLAIYLLQQAHLGLKTIHGRVIRVIKN